MDIQNNQQHMLRNIYVVDKDFQKMYEDLIVTKAAQWQSQHCKI